MASTPGRTTRTNSRVSTNFSPLHLASLMLLLTFPVFFLLPANQEVSIFSCPGCIATDQMNCVCEFRLSVLSTQGVSIISYPRFIPTDQMALMCFCDFQLSVPSTQAVFITSDCYPCFCTCTDQMAWMCVCEFRLSVLASARASEYLAKERKVT